MTTYVMNAEVTNFRGGGGGGGGANVYGKRDYT